MIRNQHNIPFFTYETTPVPLPPVNEAWDNMKMKLDAASPEKPQRSKLRRWYLYLLLIIPTAYLTYLHKPSHKNAANKSSNTKSVSAKTESQKRENNILIHVDSTAVQKQITQHSTDELKSLQKTNAGGPVKLNRHSDINRVNVHTLEFSKSGVNAAKKILSLPKILPKKNGNIDDFFLRRPQKNISPYKNEKDPIQINDQQQFTNTHSDNLPAGLHLSANNRHTASNRRKIHSNKYQSANSSLNERLSVEPKNQALSKRESTRHSTQNIVNHLKLEQLREDKDLKNAIVNSIKREVGSFDISEQLHIDLSHRFLMASQIYKSKQKRIQHGRFAAGLEWQTALPLNSVGLFWKDADGTDRPYKTIIPSVYLSWIAGKGRLNVTFTPYCQIWGDQRLQRSVTMIDSMMTSAPDSLGNAPTYSYQTTNLLASVRKMYGFEASMTYQYFFVSKWYVEAGLSLFADKSALVESGKSITDYSGHAVKTDSFYALNSGDTLFSSRPKSLLPSISVGFGYSNQRFDFGIEAKQDLGNFYNGVEGNYRVPLHAKLYFRFQLWPWKNKKR